MTWEEDIANFRLPLHLHRKADLWVQALIMEGRAGGQQAGGEGRGDVFRYLLLQKARGLAALLHSEEGCKAGAPR